VLVSPLLDVDYAAFGGKYGIFPGGLGRHGNQDIQMNAETERIACGKRYAPMANIFAGSALFKIFSV